jgi:DNA-binding NtrC family response regulator
MPEDFALPVAHAPAAAQPRPPVAVGNFPTCVKDCKQALIREALRQAQANQTKAVELLGLQRTYLVKLLSGLGIRDA